ncbi:MAG: GntR family transcriptional regulator [Chloroflexota bacterium]
MNVRVRHIRATILSGELKDGMKLPSTQALADELNISHNTCLSIHKFYNWKVHVSILPNRLFRTRAFLLSLNWERNPRSTRKTT